MRLNTKFTFLFLFFFYLNEIQARSLCSEVIAESDVRVKFTREFGRPEWLGTVSMVDPDHPEFIAEGRVNREENVHVLRLYFILKNSSGGRSQKISGRAAIEKIIYEFEKRGIHIDEVEGAWGEYLQEVRAPSDNFLAFANAYYEKFYSKIPQKLLPNSFESMPQDLQQKFIESVSEAAQATWTGQQVQQLGFLNLSRIAIVENGYRSPLDGRSGTIDIRVLWTRNRKGQGEGVRVLDPRGSSYGSSLPRFHHLLDFLIRHKMM